VFTVTSAADAGPGTLREAVARADAAPDPDEVAFDPALAGRAVGLSTVGDISAGRSALLVTTPVTVTGTGQTITRIGEAAFRLFTVTGTGSLTLTDLTLTNGLAQGGFDRGAKAAMGGAIYNQGTLRVVGCTLTGNQAVGGPLLPSGLGPGGNGNGGAVFNDGGAVTILNSTLTGNSAVGAGGMSAGSGFGGGVFNTDGAVTLTNVTIAGNTVGSRGFAIAPPAGGAVYNFSSAGVVTVTLANCVLANTTTTGTAPVPIVPYDVVNNQQGGTATLDATGPNLVSVAVLNAGGGVTGVEFTVADPLLGPLQDNGGPTQTLAPSADSPAIDAGDNAAAAGIATDQRGDGFARVSRGRVDLGAVEVQFPLAPVLVGGPPDGTALVLDPSDGSYQPGAALTFFPDFAGGVRTAVADVTGDGVPDFVGGAGPGGGPRVAVLDGATGGRVADFFAFEPSFAGGVFVAAADLDGDGRAEVAVTPDRGGGPVVAVYSGAALSSGTAGQLARFFGIGETGFRGGARPALGDVNGDGTPDLVVSAGYLGGPRIAVFDGRSLAAGPVKLLPDFFAFEPGLRNGAFVAAGDVTGDGRADLAFGGGPGGAPRVRLFDGAALLAAASFASPDDVPGA
jgi:hypothetical protein